MAAVTFKCPNCGGDLRFDPGSQNYKCEYCLSEFSQQELEASNPKASADYGEKREQDQKQEQGSHSRGAVVYSCPSCGAEIVAEETTAATFCYYCHNPVVLQGKLAGEYEPDKVIPFAIDREKATESFLQFVKSRKFVPKDFFCKEQIEKISGIYFPFWMYGCRAEGFWQGSADRVGVYRRGNTQYTQTQVFDVERKGELEFTRILRNALNGENRRLVEAVQPFRVEEAKDFSMGYLSGFFAQKRDVEKKQIAPELLGEVQKHAAQMMQASVTGYAAVRAQNQELEIREEKWEYLLLPVWVMTYQGGDGRQYYYAMNGQTGKVCGVLPLDKKRLAGLFFAIFVPLLILFLMGGYFL